MKRRLRAGALLIAFMIFAAPAAMPQCSICTKTAQQMGEKPAKGMNGGILYLAFFPMAIVGVISYRWWKNNKEAERVSAS